MSKRDMHTSSLEGVLTDNMVAPMTPLSKESRVFPGGGIWGLGFILRYMVNSMYIPWTLFQKPQKHMFQPNNQINYILYPKKCEGN